MKQLALSHIAGGVQMGMAILENHWHKVGKLNAFISILALAMPLLSRHPRDMHTNVL